MRFVTLPLVSLIALAGCSKEDNSPTTPSSSQGTQTITWNALLTVSTTAGPYTFLAATSSGNGPITYAVTDPGGTGCAIGNPASPVLTFSAAGSCVITIIAAATTTHGAATISRTFTISAPPFSGDITGAYTLSIRSAATCPSAAISRLMTISHQAAGLFLVLEGNDPANRDFVWGGGFLSPGQISGATFTLNNVDIVVYTVNPFVAGFPDREVAYARGRATGTISSTTLSGTFNGTLGFPSPGCNAANHSFTLTRR